MKITKNQLKDIIKEEIQILKEELSGMDKEASTWDVLDPGWGGHISQFRKMSYSDAKFDTRKHRRRSPNAKDVELTKDALSVHVPHIDTKERYIQLKRQGEFKPEKIKAFEKANPGQIFIDFVDENPGSGETRAFVFEPRDPNTVYMVPIAKGPDAMQKQLA